MKKTPKLRGQKMYDRAYAIAARAHAGQTRHDKKTPYFEHVKEVAARVRGWELKTIAILHDTMEDCGVTETQLADEGFPQPVIDAVKALTKPPGTKDYLGEIRKKVLPNPLAAQVKIADNYANMRDRILQWPHSEKARQKLHDYASSIALLTRPKATRRKRRAGRAK